MSDGGGNATKHPESDVATHKRRCRAFTAAPPQEATTTATTPTLPSDLVLEIVARTDAATLVRCAACCKPLRREILSPAFIRRICHGPGAAVPPRLLAFLQSYGKFFRPAGYSLPPPPFSLVHPATPAAACISDKHIAPFVSSHAAGLLALYDPVTSRGGLVVLRRRSHGVPQATGICVYDPLTSSRVFLPDPPKMANFSPNNGFSIYALLTAADGIGCSFLLLAINFKSLVYPVNSIGVRTFSSSSDVAGGEWSPVIWAACDRRSNCYYLHPDCAAVVLGGSVVHWVMHDDRSDRFHVLTYNVGTTAVGLVDLPAMDLLPESYRNCNDANLRLMASPDGRLSLIVRDKLTLSVWRQLAGGGGWVKHAVIDTETKLRSLLPELAEQSWQHNAIWFTSVGERSGVLLFYLVGDNEKRIVALDVETKEMHRVSHGRPRVQAFLFEIDLESRLSGMKTF